MSDNDQNNPDPKEKKDKADYRAKEEDEKRDKEGNFAEDPEELADEWGDESFPTSDPPANY
ncbi:hypothetical protein [Corynebacterium halotolerans]|uniref:hypothetical protein n=1 Tax=Corynebacterium halotolerans TaxID=225326 RepID=UPI003CF0CD76